MKSNRKKRILAAILCMVMVLTNNFSILAETTGAVDNTAEIETPETEVSEEVIPEEAEPEESVKTPEIPEEVVQEEPAKTPEEPEEVVSEEPAKTPEVPEEVVQEEPAKTPEEPQEVVPETLQELKYEDEQVNIAVTALEEGAIPEGAALKVVPITLENEETKAEYETVGQKIQEKVSEEDKVVAGFLAYDITFTDAKGNELEPNGKVKVSMSYKDAVIPETVKENGGENAEVSVLHLEEDENGNVKDVVNMSIQDTTKVETRDTEEGQVVQNVETETESFSVFTITWSTPLNDILTINAEYGYLDSEGNWVSLEKEIAKLNEKPADYEIPGLTDRINLTEEKYQIKIPGYTHQKTVVDDYNKGTEVSVLSPGLNMVSGKYYIRYLKENKPFQWIGTEKGYPKEGKLYFVYTQNPPEATIKDNIINSGSLEVEISNANKDVKEYKWYKSNSETGEYKLVERQEFEHGKSNISADGSKLYPAYDEGARMHYKVEVIFLDDSKMETKPYQVPYFNELQNGGFEKVSVNVKRDHDQQTNEEYVKAGGVWKSTGEGQTGDSKKFVNIETISTTNKNGSFKGTYKWYEGDGSTTDDAEDEEDTTQFAEINCEAAGALYQDVLTMEGEELSYWLSHKARGDNKDNNFNGQYRDEYDEMYLVIVPTSIANENHLETQDNLLDFLNQYATIEIKDKDTWNREKHQNETQNLYNKNGILIQRIVSNDVNWHNISQSLAYVPTSSLTRFFFMSGNTASGYNTVGNFVDRVGFSQKLPPVKKEHFTIQISKKIEGLSKERLAQVKNNIQFDISATDKSGKTLTDEELTDLFGVKTIKGTDMSVSADGTTLTYSLEYKPIVRDASYTVKIEEKKANLAEYVMTPKYKTKVITEGGTTETISGDGSIATIKQLAGGTSAAVKFTNSYEDTRYKNINFTKVWDDGGGKFDNVITRPDDLDVTLTASIFVKGENVPLEDLTKTATVNKKTEWKTSWEVPVYRVYKGEEAVIQYKVTEGEIQSEYVYTSSPSNGVAVEGDGSGYPLSDFSGVETLNDSNGQTTNKLKSEEKPDGYTSSYEITLSNDNNQSYIWNNLSKNYLSNIKYEYEDKNIAVAATNVTDENCKDENYYIVNKLETSKVVINKVWEGNQDNLKLPPSLQVKVNGKSYTLTAKDNWKKTITTLRKKKPSYEAEEIIPEGYRQSGKTIKLKDDGGAVISFTNAKIYTLPSTGGPGIFGYMIGGTLLLMAAALLLYKMKREEVLKS